MAMTKTERRFREGLGIKYMADGQRARCQAQSKNQLREWRVVHQDWITANDDIWPDCQCVRAAVPGTYACTLHGGLTPAKDKPQSLLDVIPIDLSDKFKTIMENPEYLSNRNDIMLMILRQWDLIEQLGNQAGSKDDWDKVQEVDRLLKRGELVKASSLLQNALDSHKNKKDVWDEIYKVENVVKDLRSAETKIAKDLKLMASADQVERLMDRVFTVLMRGIEKYVTDSSEQVRFIQYIVGELSNLVNIGPATVGYFLESGGEEKE